MLSCCNAMEACCGANLFKKLLCNCFTPAMLPALNLIASISRCACELSSTVSATACIGKNVAIAAYKVQFSLQVFLITDGQPINMADYEGLILLEEHIDGVSLLDVHQQQGTNTLLCIGIRQTTSILDASNSVLYKQAYSLTCTYRLQIVHVAISI